MSELTDKMFENFWKGHNKNNKPENVISREEARKIVGNNEKRYMKSPKNMEELFKKVEKIDKRLGL